MQVWSDTNPLWVFFLRWALRFAVGNGVAALSHTALDVRTGAGVTAAEHLFYPVSKSSVEKLIMMPIVVIIWIWAFKSYWLTKINTKIILIPRRFGNFTPEEARPPALGQPVSVPHTFATKPCVSQHECVVRHIGVKVKLAHFCVSLYVHVCVFTVWELL